MNMTSGLYTQSELVRSAQLFALAAHTSQGQKRKNTGVDYIIHPRQVYSCLVFEAEGVTDTILAAALLHDVVEDSHITFEDLSEVFPSDVVLLVRELTRPKGEGNRTARFEEELKRLRYISEEAKLIKLADRYCNCIDLTTQKPGEEFTILYLEESERVLKEALDTLDNAFHRKVLHFIDNKLRYMKGEPSLKEEENRYIAESLHKDWGRKLNEFFKDKI